CRRPRPAPRPPARTTATGAPGRCRRPAPRPARRGIGAAAPVRGCPSCPAASGRSRRQRGTRSSWPDDAALSPARRRRAAPGSPAAGPGPACGRGRSRRCRSSPGTRRSSGLAVAEHQRVAVEHAGQALEALVQLLLAGDALTVPPGLAGIVPGTLRLRRLAGLLLVPPDPAVFGDEIGLTGEGQREAAVGEGH